MLLLTLYSEERKEKADFKELLFQAPRNTLKDSCPPGSDAIKPAFRGPNFATSQRFLPELQLPGAQTAGTALAHASSPH